MQKMLLIIRLFLAVLLCSFNYCYGVKRLFTDILGSLNTETLKRLLIRAWIHLDVPVWSFMCIAVSFWECWVTVWCAIVNSAVPKPELLEKALSGSFIYTQYLFQMVGKLIMLPPCFSRTARQRQMYPIIPECNIATS